MSFIDMLGYSYLSGAVVQLKTITGALSGEESLSSSVAEKTKFLQQILVYVVSIIFIFIDTNSYVDHKAQFNRNIISFSFKRDGTFQSNSSSSINVLSEKRLQWRQKAVVSVMEAGGLNWLVGKVGNSKFMFHLLCFFDKSYIYVHRHTQRHTR